MKRTAIAILLLAASANAETLRLRDGTLLFGEILSHDEGGVRAKRLDTGGVVDLRWEHFTPEDANRLRAEFGYLDHADEEFRVLADRIRIADGTEEIGFIVENRPDDFVVRRRETTFNVPKARVVPPIDRIEVNALAVYTRDQLYNEHAATLDLGTAAGNLELARFCVRILDFRRAADHYRKVKELDPALNPGEVSSKITRCEERAARQEEVDALNDIGYLRSRGEFSKALAACDAFKTKYATSPLVKDLDRQRKLTVEARDRKIAEAVVFGWYELAPKVAQEKGSNRETTIDEARAFADREMTKEILKRVLERAMKLNPDLDEGTARSLWDKRIASKLARTQRARYGSGTFVLGREKAREGLDPAKEAESKPAEDPEKKALEEKIKKYLKALQSQQTSTAAGEEEEPQSWWDRVPSAARAQWLLAYYAENSGDVEVLRPWADACRACGGKGVIEVLNAGTGSPSGGGGGRGGSRGAQGGQSSGPQFRLCPDCHGIQIERYVTWR